MNQVSTKLKQNQTYLDQILNTEKNFDIIYRSIKIAGTPCGFYFIDGFVKDEVMQKMMDFFYSIKEADMPENVGAFLETALPYVEVEEVLEYPKVITNLLSGVLCFFIEGYEKCIAIDCRTYPARGVEEPEKDKVLRGARDGFVETIVFNTALIRRRIRNPKLTMEMVNIGTSSKSDVVICYMEDRVDQKLLERVHKIFENIQVDALTMNQESLEECIYKRKWYNPFPKFKYTERPDTTSASVLEGKIAVLVDTAPAAMIFPMTLFGIMEEANDYYFPPITGSYLRFSRIVITLLTLLITPLFVLLMDNPAWIPPSFSFILPKEPVNIPIILQMLILEFSIDGLRLAAINTPSMLTTPLSVIAGLVVGEFAVKSGWFNAESMLYMAFVAIANYTQSSYELGYALKFMRLLILISTGIFGLWGFIGGILVTFLIVLWNKTISGESYLYPLIPFNGKRLLQSIFRVPLKK